MKRTLIILLLLIPSVSFGQDFGPHTFSLSPKNATTLSFYYDNIITNLSPSKDVVLEHGTVDVNAITIPLVHTFSLAGHLSQAFLTNGFASLSGTANSSNKQFDIVDVNGLLDANLMLRVGLINTPALDKADFAKRELDFQLSGLVSIILPIGQYDQNRRVNLGGNRWAFKLGTPMIVPLNKNKKKIFQWEIVPSVTFFTKNSEPFAGDAKSQKPLYWLEQHLSKNFTPRFWGSINMDYQYGGQATVDGSNSGGIINQLGAGITLAYVPFAEIPLSVNALYSKTWFNNSSGYLAQLGAGFKF